MSRNTLFIALLLVVFISIIPSKLLLDRQISSNRQKKVYDRILNNAISEANKATLSVVTNTGSADLSEGKDFDHRKVMLNLDRANEVFDRNMNINEIPTLNEGSTMDLRLRTPIRMVTVYDGYYISYWDDSNKSKLKQVWSDKINYNYFFDNYQLMFTLGDDIYAKPFSGSSNQEMKLYKMYDNPNENKDDNINKLLNVTFKKSDYDALRQEVIRNSLETNLALYTSKSNISAKRFNVNYTFTIPNIDECKINDIGYYAFTQGLPLRTGGTYDAYGYGSAQLRDSIKYGGFEKDGVKYYHLVDCDCGNKNNKIYDTQSDASKDGYTPYEPCFRLIK